MSEKITGRKEYQGFYKDNEGEAHVVDMESKTFEAEPPEFSYLTQAAPTIIRSSRANRRPRTDLSLVDLPDIQFGYRRLPDGTLLPTHDPNVLDVGLQITKEIQPDLIILGGDELDLPTLSKYPPDSLHFVSTLQQSIDGLHKYLAQLRADNPNARIINLDSNHVQRIGHFMLKNAMPLFGIRPANMPDNWPSISYGALLRLDELEIEYSGGYPAGEFVINDRLLTKHGDKANAKGSTAAMYIRDYEQSLMFHHAHRIESLSRTQRNGRIVTAFSFGCQADTTGAVPSFGNAVDDRGQVVPHQENWQTGIGHVQYGEGDKPFTFNAIPIDRTEGYVTMYDGKEYRPHA